MNTWHSSTLQCFNGTQPNTKQLPSKYIQKINKIINNNNNSTVLLLSEIHIWHTSISTSSVHKCHLTAGLSAFLWKSSHNLFPQQRYIPLTPCCNKFDARRQFLLLPGQDHTWLTAQEGGVYDISLSAAGNMWRVCYELVCVFECRSHKRFHISVVRCQRGVQSWAHLWMNMGFKGAHNLDLIAIISTSFTTITATFIRMPSMKPLSWQLRPATVRVTNKQFFYSERLSNSSAFSSW